MANMSYTRFRNTARDLEECGEVLENQGLLGKDDYDEYLSIEELDAAIGIIEHARQIAEMFEDEDLDDVRTDFLKIVGNE